VAGNLFGGLAGEVAECYETGPSRQNDSEHRKQTNADISSSAGDEFGG